MLIILHFYILFHFILYYFNYFIDVRFESQLDNNHLNKVGKIVPLEGFHGAILEIQKMVKNVETSSLSVSLFGDEDTNDKVKPTSSVEEEDYLNPDVQFILDLIRFT